MKARRLFLLILSFAVSSPLLFSSEIGAGGALSYSEKLSPSFFIHMNASSFDILYSQKKASCFEINIEEELRANEIFAFTLGSYFKMNREYDAAESGEYFLLSFDFDYLKYIYTDIDIGLGSSQFFMKGMSGATTVSLLPYLRAEAGLDFGFLSIGAFISTSEKASRVFQIIAHMGLDASFTFGSWKIASYAFFSISDWFSNDVVKEIYASVSLSYLWGDI